MQVLCCAILSPCAEQENMFLNIIQTNGKQKDTQQHYFCLYSLYSDSEILKGENKEDLLCSVERSP